MHPMDVFGQITIKSGYRIIIANHLLLHTLVINDSQNKGVTNTKKRNTIGTIIIETNAVLIVQYKNAVKIIQNQDIDPTLYNSGMIINSGKLFNFGTIIHYKLGTFINHNDYTLYPEGFVWNDNNPYGKTIRIMHTTIPLTIPRTYQIKNYFEIAGDLTTEGIGQYGVANIDGIASHEAFTGGISGT